MGGDGEQYEIHSIRASLRGTRRLEWQHHFCTVRLHLSYLSAFQLHSCACKHHRRNSNILQCCSLGLYEDTVLKGRHNTRLQAQVLTWSFSLPLFHGWERGRESGWRRRRRQRRGKVAATAATAAIHAVASVASKRQRGDLNPMRAEPNAFRVHHLSHSVTLSWLLFFGLSHMK